MRQFIGILCSTALLTAGACSKDPEGQAPESVNAGSEDAAAAESYYTVEAHDITNNTITAVQGTFAMVPATAANGILSNGRGGACLVFRAKDLGFTTMDAKKCTKSSDCTVLPPPDITDPNNREYYSYSPNPADPDHREARFGYCDTQNKQCWAKPITDNGGNAVCNRPIVMTAGTVNLVPNNPPPPPPPAAGPINVSKWVEVGDKVRVVACIQKPNAKPGLRPGGTGCASSDGPDRIEVMGNPTPLHK